LRRESQRQTQRTQRLIDKRTVFVLGAGASCPYGYPSGAELRRYICLDFPKRYEEYLSQYSDKGYRDSKLLSIKHFADTFFNSSTPSIDLFLARNLNLVETGKYIISFIILDMEQKSHFNEQAIKGQDWYSFIFNKLTAGVVDKRKLSAFSRNKVSFITFNYDRSLEHYLYKSLLNSFTNVPPSRIAQEIGSLEVIHVYGKVAPLDWQDGQNGVPYSMQFTERLVSTISDNIKTIYERQEGDEFDDIYVAFQEAEQIFCLGFGFAEENVEILKLPELIASSAYLYGTGFRLEPRELKKVKSMIIDKLPIDPMTGKNAPDVRISIEDMDCLRLLRNYL